MKSLIGICERYEENGDDILIKNVVLFSLRGCVTLGDPPYPRADWTPDEIRERIQSDACAMVVVVLDVLQNGRELGPKCYAGIDAAQKSGKPYVVLVPALTAVALWVDVTKTAVIRLGRNGCPDLLVPAEEVTHSFDRLLAVVTQCMRMSE